MHSPWRTLTNYYKKPVKEARRRLEQFINFIIQRFTGIAVLIYPLKQKQRILPRKPSLKPGVLSQPFLLTMEVLFRRFYLGSQEIA